MFFFFGENHVFSAPQQVSCCLVSMGGVRHRFDWFFVFGEFMIFFEVSLKFLFQDGIGFELGFSVMFCRFICVGLFCLIIGLF